MRSALIRTIAAKDLRESAANAQVLLPVVIVPLIFVVVYPVGLLLALRSMDLSQADAWFARIPPGTMPELTGLTLAGKTAYLTTVYVFAGLFLIIPTMMATVLAANSFAGEKERHTLEGVLYTPVTDTELVVGKVLGAAVPSVAFSWLCFLVYAVLVNAFGAPLVGRLYFPTLNWWVLMVLVVPAISLFLTACVVWVSAHVSSYQAANSIGGFAVLPIVLLVVGQATGVMVAGPVVFAVLGLLLVGLDVVLMRWVIRTFDRERVVTSFL